MVDYLIDVCIRFNPLLMMSAIEVMQLLKSWCFFLGLINLIIFCFSQVLGVGILVFLILLFCILGFICVGVYAVFTVILSSLTE